MSCVREGKGCEGCEGGDGEGCELCEGGEGVRVV